MHTINTSGNTSKAVEAARELLAFVNASSALVERALQLEASGGDAVSKVFAGTTNTMYQTSYAHTSKSP